MKRLFATFFKHLSSCAMCMLATLMYFGLAMPVLAASSSPQIECSRIGSIGVSTADNYLVFLEMKKRNLVKSDFETWFAEQGGADGMRLVKDDLSLLYRGQIRSPALFGVHSFYRCMDAAKANIKWVNANAIPMCFLNLEVAQSIASAKRLNKRKEEVIDHLRSIGYTNVIDNGIGLSKVNEMIDQTYKTTTIAEEIDFQEAMIQRCEDASKLNAY